MTERTSSATVERPSKACLRCGAPILKGSMNWKRKKYCGSVCVKAAQREIPDTTRFWTKVSKGDGCWLWAGAKNDDGYGHFGTWVDGKRRTLNAHKYSYELHVGAVPSGLCVMHTCDVPACVNPAHMKLGTHQENMADAGAKGRVWRGGNRRTKEERSEMARRANKVRWDRWRAERGSHGQ